MKATFRILLGLLLAGAVTTAAIFAQQPRSNQDSGATLHLTPMQAAAPYVIGVDGPSNVYHQWQSQAQAAELAKQIVKEEKEESKKEIRKKLADLLNEQFEAHTAQQKKELDDLEKQIANLKSLLKKRQDAKSTIVERRMDQLIHEAEGLGWNTPNNTWFGYSMSGGGKHAIAAPLSVPAKKDSTR
jgi:hypothetical protein